tara:strand:+ start:491 stop:2104 length:1614 start_codon:yes stop_codon:yes gene_type:complete
MREVFVAIALGGLALTTPAIAQVEAPSSDAKADYTFDADAYTRLRVVVDWDDPSATNVFTAEFCPESDLMGFDVLDLVKGDKSVALTIGISAPQIDDLNLNIYNITIDRKFFGVDCDSSFQRIDFMSPLYLGGQYDGTTVSITPKLVVADEPSQLFSDGLNSVIAAANAVSALPAPFLDNKDKVVARVIGQFSSRTGVSDTIQFNIGSTGRHSEEWAIPGSVAQRVPALSVRAYFETVPSYFTRPSSGWSASNILSRSFPSGSQFGYSNFRAFANGLGSSYTSTVAATDLATFDANCRTLQSDIARQGLTPMDRSLIMWAIARSEANLKDVEQIDHTACMSSVFAELGRFEATKDITSRAIPAVISTAEVVPASERQMRATIESDSRFAVFLRTGDWPTRRTASEQLFGWPTHFADSSDTKLMEATPLDLANSDQWQTRYARSSVAFASRVGCYLFKPNTGAGNSVMLAIVDFGSEDATLERLVRLTFGNVEEVADAAPVTRFDILDESASREELNLVKSRHQSSCGADRWRPALLR